MIVQISNWKARKLSNDLDILDTALYVTCDDLLAAHPEVLSYRPKVGIAPKISDAELVTLAAMQALMNITSEARWVRYARKHLTGLFPAIPGQSGYNKRLRKLAGLMSWLIPTLAKTVSVYADDVWVVDSTPIECARSREIVKRSDLAGFGEYGYCAPHSRFFWGLRLHMLSTLDGLPTAFAVTGAKADERYTLLGMLNETENTTGQLLLADKGYNGKELENELNEF